MAAPGLSSHSVGAKVTSNSAASPAASEPEAGLIEYGKAVVSASPGGGSRAPWSGATGCVRSRVGGTSGSGSGWKFQTKSSGSGVALNMRTVTVRSSYTDSSSKSTVSWYACRAPLSGARSGSREPLPSRRSTDSTETDATHALPLSQSSRIWQLSQTKSSRAVCGPGLSGENLTETRKWSFGPRS